MSRTYRLRRYKTTKCPKFQDGSFSLSRKISEEFIENCIVHGIWNVPCTIKRRKILKYNFNWNISYETASHDLCWIDDTYHSIHILHDLVDESEVKYPVLPISSHPYIRVSRGNKWRAACKKADARHEKYTEARRFRRDLSRGEYDY